MEKSELDEIRAKVALEPEGSPARILLAELDRLHKVEIDQANEKILSYFMQKGLSEEEAAKVLEHIRAGKKLEYERGPCRVCKGSGSINVPGCIGSHFERCDECYGRRHTSRIKIPALPGVATQHGED